MKNSLGKRVKIKMGLETPEERKKRIAREKKENIKTHEYFESIYSKPEPVKYVEIPLEWMKAEVWKEGKAYFRKENRKFIVDERNKGFLDCMCRYFADDYSFEEVVENGELRKGLLIYGACGTGKSSIFDIIQNISQKHNLTQLWFSNLSVHQVVNQFNKENKQNKFVGGESVIDIYSRGKVHFDDLGTEKEVQAWGIKENLFDRLLQIRYNNFKEKGTKTFVTTNLSIKELESKYCKQVKDRLYQMFNFIPLNGDSRRF